MKKFVAGTLTAIMLGIGASTAVAPTPAPIRIPFNCTESRVAEPTNILALHVGVGTALLCTIPRAIAVTHPEITVSYKVDRMYLARRKNDELPFVKKGQERKDFAFQLMKRIPRLNGTVFLATPSISRKCQSTQKDWEWQGYSDITITATMLDFPSRRVTADTKKTGLMVSTIAEIKCK